MIELRWVRRSVDSLSPYRDVREQTELVLQYRVMAKPPVWSDWQDVPVENGDER